MRVQKFNAPWQSWPLLEQRLCLCASARRIQTFRSWHEKFSSNLQNVSEITSILHLLQLVVIRTGFWKVPWLFIHLRFSPLPVRSLFLVDVNKFEEDMQVSCESSQGNFRPIISLRLYSCGNHHFWKPAAITYGHVSWEFEESMSFPFAERKSVGLVLSS